MEERGRRHHAVALEDEAVLHHELHVPQRVDVVERVARERNQIREVARLDRPARLVDVRDAVAVRRDRAQDVGVRDACVLPWLQEFEAQLAARLAGDEVIGVGRERHLHVVLVRVLHAGDGARVRVLRHRMTLQAGRRLGARAPDAFGRHLLVKIVVERAAVLDRPDPAVDRVLRAGGRLHVAGHFHSGLRRLAHEHPDLVGRVAVRLAVDADLDHLRAEQDVLTHRLHDLVRRVRVEILRVDDVVVLRHLGRREELAAHAAYDDSRVDDRRARKPSLLDRLPQRGVGVVAVVPEVADDGEAGREHLHAVRRRLDRAQRRRVLHVGVVVDVVLGLGLVGQREVVVRVDEARHHRHAGEIDHLSARRNGDVRPDVANPAAFDDDDLIGEDPPAVGIEQAAGADRGDRRRRGRLGRRGSGNEQREPRQKNQLRHGGEAIRRWRILQLRTWNFGLWNA